MKRGYVIAGVVTVLLVVSILHRRSAQDIAALALVTAVAVVLYRMKRNEGKETAVREEDAKEEVIEAAPLDDAVEVLGDDEISFIQPVPVPEGSVKEKEKRTRLQVLLDFDDLIYVDADGRIWMVYLTHCLEAKLTDKDYRYYFDRNAQEDEDARKRRLAEKYFAKDIVRIFEEKAAEAGYVPVSEVDN